jgi:hypothetical protein
VACARPGSRSPPHTPVADSDPLLPVRSAALRTRRLHPNRTPANGTLAEAAVGVQPLCHSAACDLAKRGVHGGCAFPAGDSGTRVFRLSPLVSRRRPPGAARPVPDAAASARTGRAASGRSPRDARLPVRSSPPSSANPCPQFLAYSFPSDEGSARPRRRARPAARVACI